nr:MAG TPA: hypothetical protein [Caudoviricetes sp.]
MYSFCIFSGIVLVMFHVLSAERRRSKSKREAPLLPCCAVSQPFSCLAVVCSCQFSCALTASYSRLFCSSISAVAASCAIERRMILYTSRGMRTCLPRWMRYTLPFQPTTISSLYRSSSLNAQNGTMPSSEASPAAMPRITASAAFAASLASSASFLACASASFAAASAFSISSGVLCFLLSAMLIPPCILGMRRGMTPSALPSVHRAALKGRGGFDAHHVLLHQTLRHLGQLPACGGTLVQRVSRTGGTQLLDDVLQAAALQLRHAVSICAEDQGRVHVAAICAALAGVHHRAVGHSGRCRFRSDGSGTGSTCGSRFHLQQILADQNVSAGQRLGLLVGELFLDGNDLPGRALGGQVAGAFLAAVLDLQGSGMEDLCLCGLHKAHALDLADLALIDAVGVGVGLHIHPLLVAHQVIGGVGVDDTGKVAVDLLRVHDLQGAYSLADVIHRQVLVVLGGAVAAHQLRAILRTTGVHHVGAASQHLAGDGVGGTAGLRCQQAGGLHQVVVDGRQLQNIGQLDVAAVLLDGGADHAHAQLLTGGGHTFCQGHQRLGQTVVLSELDGFTAVLGDGVLLAKLVMDQLRLGEVDEAHRVIHLHLVAQTGIQRGIGVCVKQVQHHRHQVQVVVNCVHVIAPFRISQRSRRSKGNAFASCYSPLDFLKVRSRQLRGIRLCNKRAVGAGAVLTGTIALGPDVIGHLLLRAGGNGLYHVAHQLVEVQHLVGVLHRCTGFQQVYKLVVLQLLHKVKVLVHGIAPHGLRLHVPLLALRPDLRLLLLHLLAAKQLGVFPPQTAKLLVLLLAHARLLGGFAPVGVVVVHGLQQTLCVPVRDAVTLHQRIQHRLVGLHPLLRLPRLLEAPVDHPLCLLGVQILVLPVDQLPKSLFLGLQRVGRGLHVLHLIISPGVGLYFRLALRLFTVFDVGQCARFALAGGTGACLCIALCGGSCRPIAALAVKEAEGDSVKVHICSSFDSRAYRSRAALPIHPCGGRRIFTAVTPRRQGGSIYIIERGRGLPHP